MKRQFGITLKYEEITEFLENYYDVLAGSEEMERRDFELPFEEFEGLIAPRRFSTTVSDEELESKPVKKPPRKKRKR